MIGFILATAASAPTAMPVPAPPPLTAESLTTPRVDIRCKVLGRDQSVRTIEFRASGTQGYPTSGVPAFKATEPSFVVLKDETGTFSPADTLYDNTAFEKFSGRWENGSLGRFDRSGTNFSAVRFLPNWDKSAAIVLERQTPPMMSGAPNFAFAGICQYTETSQSPLAAAPVKKEAAQ
jgi:hypothetical protein